MKSRVAIWVGPSCPLAIDEIDVAGPGPGAVVIGGAPTGAGIPLRAISLLMGRTRKGTMLGGTRGRTDVPHLVDLYMKGEVKVDPLVTHFFSLEKINEGFTAIKNGTAIGPVMLFDQPYPLEE